MSASSIGSTWARLFGGTSNNSSQKARSQSSSRRGMSVETGELTTSVARGGASPPSSPTTTRASKGGSLNANHQRWLHHNNKNKNRGQRRNRSQSSYYSKEVLEEERSKSRHLALPPLQLKQKSAKAVTTTTTTLRAHKGPIFSGYERFLTGGEPTTTATTSQKTVVDISEKKEVKNAIEEEKRCQYDNTNNNNVVFAAATALLRDSSSRKNINQSQLQPIKQPPPTTSACNAKSLLPLLQQQQQQSPPVAVVAQGKTTTSSSSAIATPPLTHKHRSADLQKNYPGKSYDSPVTEFQPHHLQPLPPTNNRTAATLSATSSILLPISPSTVSSLGFIDADGHSDASAATTTLITSTYTTKTTNSIISSTVTAVPVNSINYQQTPLTPAAVSRITTEEKLHRLQRTGSSTTNNFLDNDTPLSSPQHRQTPYDSIVGELSKKNKKPSTPTKAIANSIRRNLLFKRVSSGISVAEMRKAFAKAVTGGSSSSTAASNASNAAASAINSTAAHSQYVSSQQQQRYSPTKSTTQNGPGDSKSPHGSSTMLAHGEKDRTIAELERRLRASELDNERLRKELDKVKSVLSITHSPNKIAAASAAGRRVAQLDEGGVSGMTGSSEAANQLNFDEEQQHEAEKATPNMGGGGGGGGSGQFREHATKKLAISAESGIVADVKLEKVDKDFRSKHLIKNAILDNDFLKHLDAGQMKELVEYMYPMQVPAGVYIIRQSEEGTHLYVAALGSFTVEKDGISLGRIEAGKAFGELAILYGCNRTASVKSNEPSKLWVLDRKVFQKIMIRNTTERQQEMVKLLRSVPVLSTLNDIKLRKVADALEVDFYSAGDFIIRQGETGDYFFILNKGEVKITQHVTGSGDRIINTLKKGDFFGEKALVREEKRTASVIAITDVECLALNRQAFTSLIGDIKDIIDKEYIDSRRESLPPLTPAAGAAGATSQFSERQAAISVPSPMPSPPEEDISHIIERPTPADFVVVATLGVGGFGRVVLVQHRAVRERTFAMKVMKKRHVVKTRQQEHVMSEKEILMRSHSPFICRLFATMKDARYLYMLMEFLQGGELWTILRDCTFFDEVTVRFYTACALSALEYLHDRCIIYRDLKPENMMLDSNGYGKLVDFGFAKNIEVNRKTWTFCGTPQYMAPEIILNKGHDHAVDYYALGIFMYELSAGTPPFEYNGDQLQCYNQIIRGISAVEFPRHMSRGCISLIKRLCRLTAVERLGYQKGGVKDIKKHKFFQGFDWAGLAKRSVAAPIKPTIKGPTDTANFDEGFPPDNDVVEDDNSGWDELF